HLDRARCFFRGSTECRERAARNDDAVLVESAEASLARRARQAMAIGGHQNHLPLVAMEQHTGELWTRGVAGRRLVGAREEARERLPFDRDLGLGLHVRDAREVGRILGWETGPALSVSVLHFDLLP